MGHNKSDLGMVIKKTTKQKYCTLSERDIIFMFIDCLLLYVLLISWKLQNNNNIYITLYIIL